MPFLELGQTVLSSKQKADLRDAFNMFDVDASNRGVIKDVHALTILQCAGFTPSSKEMQRVIAANREKTQSNLLNFDTVLKLANRYVTYS